MHKNFKIDYAGMQGLDLEQMRWNFSNDYDKEGSDKKNLIPLSAGAGVNMWLSNRVGIGLQAEYLVMPYNQVANSWNGTLRLMWRFGASRGSSRRYGMSKNRRTCGGETCRNRKDRAGSVAGEGFVRAV